MRAFIGIFIAGLLGLLWAVVLFLLLDDDDDEEKL